MTLAIAGSIGVSISVVSAPVASAATGINQQITYQGRLLTNTGAIVADGNYNIRFKIYSGGTGTTANNGGVGLTWTERWENQLGNPIVVKNGYFSVALGSTCAFTTATCQGNSNTVTAALWNQDTLWLSMDVDTAGTTSGAFTYNGEMLPMKRLTSSVYAMNAGMLQGRDATGFIQNAPGSQQSATINTISSAAGTSAAVIQGAASSTVPTLVLRAGATPSAGGDPLQIQDSTGATLLSKVDSSGNLSVLGCEVVGSTSTACVGKLNVYTSGTAVGLIVNNSGTGDSQDIYKNGILVNKTDAYGNLASYGVNQTLGNVAIPVITLGTGTTGTAFYYTVTAANQQSETIGSNIIGTTTSSITLNWTQIPGATGYNIYRHAATNNFTSASCTTAGGCLVGQVPSGLTTTFTDFNNSLLTGTPPATSFGTGLSIQGWASQSNNVFQILNAAGATNLAVNGNGDLTIKSTTNSSSALTVLNSSGNNVFSVSTSGGTAALGNITTTAGAGVQGQLLIADGSVTGRYTQLLTSALTVGSQQIIIPDTAGVGGTVCLTTTCAANGSFLQASPTSATTSTSNFNGTMYAFTQQSTGAASGVLSIANAGVGNALSVTSTNTSNGVTALAVTQTTPGSLPGSPVFALSVSNTSGALFAVDAYTGRVEAGSTAICTTAAGKLCVAQAVSSAGGPYTNSNNVTNITGGGAATFTSQLITTADTQSAVIDTLQGLKVDYTTSTNTSAAYNGLQLLTTSTSYNGTFLEVKQGATSQFSVTDAGVVTVAGAAASDITTVSNAAGASNGLTIKPGTSGGSSSNGASTTIKGGDGSGTTTVIGGALLLQGGSATGASGTRTGGSVSVDGGTSTTGFASDGSVNIGNGTTPTINIDGTGATDNARTINIGTGGSTTTQTVNIGNQTAATNSALNLYSAGTGTAGNILLQTNGAASGVTVKTAANSATAFTVQNASGAAIFQVDTSSTPNKLTNPGFEVNTTGWVGTSAGIGRNTTAGQYYHGQASLTTTVTTAGGGANVSSGNGGFTAAVPGPYNFSFYARNSTAGTLGVTITGGSSTCTLNSTTMVTTGFQRYSCSFTSITTNITGFTITSSTTGIFYIDAVQLTSGLSLQPYAAQGAIQLRGTINTPAIFQSTSNSTTAFQIQDSAGTANLFNVDSLNDRIGIGKLNPTTTLDVAGVITGTSYVAGATSGLSATTCTGGQVLQNQVVTGGIVTGGTCASAGVGSFITKNANDTSTATFVGNLLALSNTSTGAAGVLALANSGTSSALSVSQAAATLTSGQAVILANAATGVTGNLIDLQLNAASKFSVTTTGAVSAATSVTAPTMYTATLSSSSGAGAYLTTGSSQPIALQGREDTTVVETITGTATQSASLLTLSANGGTSSFDSGANLQVSGNSTSNITSALEVGSGSDYVLFGAVNHEPVLYGNAQHKKVLKLTAEYAGSVLDASGDATCSAANSGTMTSGLNTGTGLTGSDNTLETFYNWTTTSVTAQCYDVVINVPIPSDFSAWASASPYAVVNMNTSNVSNATMAMLVNDSTGAAMNSGTWTTLSATANVWTAANGVNLVSTAGTYYPGGTMTIRLRMSASDPSSTAGIIKAGSITLNYTSRY